MKLIYQDLKTKIEIIRDDIETEGLTPDLINCLRNNELNAINVRNFRQSDLVVMFQIFDAIEKKDIVESLLVTDSTALFSVEDCLAILAKSKNFVNLKKFKCDWPIETPLIEFKADPLIHLSNYLMISEMLHGDFIDKLLSIYPEILEKTLYGFTLLQYASVLKQTDVVQKILDVNPSSVHVFSDGGESCLKIALRVSSEEITKMLLPNIEINNEATQLSERLSSYEMSELIENEDKKLLVQYLERQICIEKADELVDQGDISQEDISLFHSLFPNHDLNDHYFHNEQHITNEQRISEEFEAREEMIILLSTPNDGYHG